MPQLSRPLAAAALCGALLTSLADTHAGARAGKPTALTGAVGLTRYFKALAAAEAGQGVARALHYGDSTLAGDGIARTVRERLAARFGDAGPGFVSAAVESARVTRADVDTKRSGNWRERSILLGGAQGRYGLGGTVGIASPGGSASIMGARGPEQRFRRVELWYQAGVGYGGIWLSADEQELVRQPATAENTEDRRYTSTIDGGFQRLKYGATDGPVPIYGVVLETGAPGATWEAQGIIGAGSRSFKAFSHEHLAEQMAWRDPDLVALQIGGNEAGFPVLQYGDGTGYMPIYQAALDQLRLAAPSASCLVISPLDQGLVEEEQPPRSKPGMPRMVNAQRRVAEAAGCGFWSAYDAMGGEGSIVRWAALSPPLAWTDYAHLSPAGLGVIGGHLSDALLAAYDAWKGQ